MKPTEKQKQLCDEIASHIKSVFGETNDIKSPSHNTLIDEFVWSLEDKGLIEKEGVDSFKLTDAMFDILMVIRKVK